MGRLGSALQSWAGRAGGDSNYSKYRREGRPGHLGAKYTTEQHAAHGYSPFEPSPHQQLRKKLPVEPAFSVAAVRGAGGDGSGLRDIGVSAGKGSSPVAEGAGRLLSENGDAVDGTGSRQNGRRGEEDREEQGTSTATNDKKVDQTQGGEAAAAPSSPCLANLEVDSGAAEAGAEAGAGSTHDSTHTNNDPGCASPKEGNVGSTEGRTRGQPSRMKTAGLWELKAERSRLEQALIEAERDRDVEKLRATEAVSRLEEAVARLESLRREGCPVVFVR